MPLKPGWETEAPQVRRNKTWDPTQVQGAPAAHAIHQSQTPAFSKHFFSRLTLFFSCPIIPLPPQELHSPAGSSLSPQIKRTACVQSVLSGVWLVLPSQQAVRREPLGGVGPRRRSSQPGSASLDTPDLISPKPPSKSNENAQMHNTNEFYIDERCERVT